MDLKLFLGVIKRYKRLVIAGTILAVLLSALSYGMPGLKGGMPTIIPRGAEIWQGNGELLISQAGFPYGRAESQVIPGKGTGTPPQVIGDPSYLSGLSSIYAALANGTAVQHQVAAQTHVKLCPQAPSTPGSATGSPPSASSCLSVAAAAVPQPDTGASLPLITLTSTAASAHQAVNLAATTISVLQTDVTKEQAAANTPVDQRVKLQTIVNGAPATLVKGHSKSIPILVLFALLSATVALAFILNNHSTNPVRSTRVRPDEWLGADRVLAPPVASNGFASPVAGNRHLAQAEHGRAATGSPKIQSERRWTGGDRQPSHVPRSSGSGTKFRD